MPLDCSPENPESVYGYQRIVDWIAQLQDLTGMTFQVCEAGRDADLPIWEPQFTEHPTHWDFLVQTPESIPLTSRLTGNSDELARARRLIALACGQMRAEHNSAQLEDELGQLTEHLHDTYEQISILHEVARKLTVASNENELTQAILNELSAAIGADVTLTEPMVAIDNGPSIAPDKRFLIKRSSPRSAQPSEHLLSMLLEIRGSQQRWLSARRAPTEPEFGSGEGLILRSVATMLETHLCNAALYREKDALLLSFVRSLVATLDARDHYTKGHSDRVAELARLLANQMGLSALDCEQIYTSGLLHDLGKIGIPDQVLRKAGPLTSPERQVIQQHPVIGFDILSDIPAFAPLLPGVRSHHEAWDGSGYPDQLSGDAIPLMARILAVADAFDAMASDRPYRSGRAFEEVDHILKQGAGQQWCPAVVAAYTECRETFLTHYRQRHCGSATATA